MFFDIYFEEKKTKLEKNDIFLVHKHIQLTHFKPKKKKEDVLNL